MVTAVVFAKGRRSTAPNNKFWNIVLMTEEIKGEGYGCHQPAGYR